MITMGKKFKKTIAMAMATAMAFSIPALPVYQADKVEAATEDYADFASNFDYVYFSEKYETVRVWDDDKDIKFLYYAFATKDKTGKVKYPKATAYETIEFNGHANIDLSNVSRKKEQVLCIATSSSISEVMPYEIQLDAQETLNVKFSGTLTEAEIEKENVLGNPNDGYLTFTKGKKSEVKDVPVDMVEFRTPNGTWQSALKLYDYNMLSTYTQKGATLQMRIAPYDSYERVSISQAEYSNLHSQGVDAADYSTYGYGYGYNEDYYISDDVYDSGTIYKQYIQPGGEIPGYYNYYKYVMNRTETEDFIPAGKVTNVKLKAKSKAPKVTVNYNDKMVSVPKGAQYSTDFGGTWKKALEKKENVAFETYGWDGEEPTYIYYRTAGDGKKSASKITYVTLKPEDDSYVKVTTPEADSFELATDPKVKDNVITATYKTAYNSNSALEFKNATDNMYQVALIKKTDLAAEKYRIGEDGTRLMPTSSSAIVAKSAKKVKWVDVSAQKDTKIGSGKLSIKKNEKASEYAILYRICDKKGTSINSSTRIMDMPAPSKQVLELVDGTTVVTEAAIASGGATTGNTLTYTVSGAGLVAASPKYKATVYSDEGCNSKSTDSVTAKVSGTTLNITTKKKASNKVCYVKVTVEGTEAVLKLTITA